MERKKRFWSLVCFLTALLCHNGGNGVYGGGATAQGNTSVVMCGGDCACVQSTGGSNSVSSQVPQYYYDEELKDCQSLPSSCNVASQDCATFTSLEACQGLCNHVGGCASSRWGCCSDGETPRDKQGRNCPKGEEEEGVSESSGVRWDLVASGICTTIILLGVISLIGVATYAYRQRHKQRQRRYIQEVLQMYDSTGVSDSSSESSYISDNPEHNNLFDRL